MQPPFYEVHALLLREVPSAADSESIVLPSTHSVKGVPYLGVPKKGAPKIRRAWLLVGLRTHAAAWYSWTSPPRRSRRSSLSGAFGGVGFAAVRWEEVECAVRPVPVVVAAVDAEHVLEMAAAKDGDPVETLSAERSYPALGVGVRSLDRRADHP
jgi:hypothetical protein